MIVLTGGKKRGVNRAYWLRDVALYGPWTDIVVIHHNEETGVVIALPDDGEWHVVCDGEQSGTVPLRQVRRFLDADGIGTWVLVKTGAAADVENGK